LIGKANPSSPAANLNGVICLSISTSGLARTLERSRVCKPGMAKLKVTYKMEKRFGIQADAARSAPVRSSSLELADILISYGGLLEQSKNVMPDASFCN